MKNIIAGISLILASVILAVAVCASMFVVFDLPFIFQFLGVVLVLSIGYYVSFPQETNNPTQKRQETITRNTIAGISLILVSGACAMFLDFAKPPVDAIIVFASFALWLSGLCVLVVEARNARKKIKSEPQP